MKILSILSVCLTVTAFGIACSEDDPPSNTNPATGGEGSIPSGGTGGSDNTNPNSVILTDAMNYVFSSSLTAGTQTVLANSDILFDWSGASVDMQGRELDPFTGVDMMQLMLWRYDEESFLAGINNDDLDTGKLVAMGYCDTQNTKDSCQFLDLVAPAGSPISDEELLEYVDPAVYPAEDHIWVVMLATGGVFGQGTRLLTFFQPDETETSTEVHITNDSTHLEYNAELANLEPVTISPNTGDILVSWEDDTQLTTNGMGATWVPTRITDVSVAHYEGYSLSDLEDQFLLLEDLASEYYTVRLSAGQEVVLSDLQDESGQPFSGIDDTGIWLIRLTCGGCRNPAPWFLSVLSPSG